MEQQVDKFATLWRSKRLSYRGFEDDEETVDIMYKSYADPVVRGLSTISDFSPPSKRQCKEIVNDSINKATLAVVMWSHDDRGEGKGTPVGWLILTKRMRGTVSIGLCVLPGFQNKGFGRETLNWALDWAFLYEGLHRVCIGTIAFNDRAASLYESVGFVQEGRDRKCAYNDGAWHDILNFSMLEDEYRRSRNAESPP